MIIIHNWNLLLFIIALPRIYSQTSIEEVKALRDLYDSANGLQWSWSNTTNAGLIWNFSTPIDTIDPCYPGHVWQRLLCEYIDYNISTIKRLYLIDFNLTGSIPSSIGNLQSLTHLSMSKNKLGNTLPSEIGLISKLDTLLVDFNQFEGSIPSALSLCKKLRDLDLDNNLFNGNFPSSIGYMSNLEYLDADNNFLTGQIPSELQYMSKLGKRNHKRITFNYLFIVLCIQWISISIKMTLVVLFLLNLLD